LSYTHPAWAVLGIAPTEDKRAIKRAYAAKLKATDVDKDPKAFIALRQALDEATWDSEYLQYAQEDEADVGLLEPETATEIAPISDEEIQPVPLPVADELAPVDDDDDQDEDPSYWRWEPQRQPATEADQERIIELLWSETPVAEIEIELVERTHAILTAEEMENIDHASSIEDWMASIIAQSIPRSDAMGRVAVPHFGWADQVDNWRTRYGVSAAAARFADLEALDRLENTSHQWHDAWVALKQPPPDAYGWKAVSKHRADIIALMASIRYHSPALESELNAEHVALWEAAISGGNTQAAEKSKGFSWWWVFWAVFALFQLARFIGDPATTPPAAPPTVQSEYQQWRAEQLPRVQQWMDANRERIDWLFANQKARGPGLPPCAALDAVASLSSEEYVHCEEAEQIRRPRAPPQLAAPVPAANVQSAQPGSRMVYTSPLWRSEQAPRVQRWMDSHPDELDRLLQPHVAKGGLPSCAKLGAAAGLSAGELTQCRSAEARRIAARIAGDAPIGNPLALPAQPKPQGGASDTSRPVAAGDPCDKPELADLAVCQKVEPVLLPPAQ
jgi:hypothetical protein